MQRDYIKFCSSLNKTIELTNRVMETIERYEKFSSVSETYSKDVNQLKLNNLISGDSSIESILDLVNMCSSNISSTINILIGIHLSTFTKIYYEKYLIDLNTDLTNKCLESFRNIRENIAIIKDKYSSERK